MFSLLQNMIKDFDVISFDIFDTLLLRPFVKPSDLFCKLERDEKAAGFAQDRIGAERRAQAEARSNGREEATLDEIYQLIPQWEPLKEKECAAERAGLVSNPEMRDVFRAAKSQGKKILVVSDMYLPADFLKDVLRENGIDGWDGFYVSSDQQGAKWSGALYDLILKDTGVVPDKILHIGDNANSDIRKANEKGIVAYGYQKVINKFYEECPFVKMFLGDNPPLGKRLFVGAMALGWHIYKYEHRDWTYWNRIGFLFAGTLGYTYMRYVGERATKKGFDHLMFVARDGYILQKIFKILYPDFHTDYFYASRSQAFLGINYFGRTEVGIKIRRRYCLKYLEGKFGIKLTNEQKKLYENRGDLPSNAREILNSVAKEKRKSAEEYLSRFAIDPERTALVDGDSTHLTVQKFVSTIVGQNIYTYYLFTNLPVENGDTLACADWDMRYLHFAEFLFGAPTPPLDDLINGEVVYKKDVPFFERFKMKCSPEIADGAISSAGILNKNKVGFNHDMWLDWNDAFMDCVTNLDKEMFSLARNSVAIGHESGYRHIIIEPETSHRRTLFGKTLFLTHTERIGTIQYRYLKLFGKITILKLSLAKWCALGDKVSAIINFFKL